MKYLVILGLLSIGCTNKPSEHEVLKAEIRQNLDEIEKGLKALDKKKVKEIATICMKYGASDNITKAEGLECGENTYRYLISLPLEVLVKSTYKDTVGAVKVELRKTINRRKK